MPVCISIIYFTQSLKLSISIRPSTVHPPSVCGTVFLHVCLLLFVLITGSLIVKRVLLHRMFLFLFLIYFLLIVLCQLYLNVLSFFSLRQGVLEWRMDHIQRSSIALASFCVSVLYKYLANFLVSLQYILLTKKKKKKKPMIKFRIYIFMLLKNYLTCDGSHLRMGSP